jgi:hypothetical protein
MTDKQNSAGRDIRDLVKDLLSGAYIDAATATHHAWIDGKASREADFGEAADDYAAEFLDAACEHLSTAPSASEQAMSAELDRLRVEINTPITDDFVRAANMEAMHQRERWGADHDAGKSPFDWFWLIGYLAQKAADAHMRGDTDKALHHTISTAAALANWHLAISGRDTSMRPGIDTPEHAVRAAQGDGDLSRALMTRARQTGQPS